MAEIAVGKGNWANASARSKARKAKLLDETRLRQLMKSGPDTIAASIGELDYRRELDIYSSRLSGADLVEAALSTIWIVNSQRSWAFVKDDSRELSLFLPFVFLIVTPKRYSVPSTAE